MTICEPPLEPDCDFDPMEDWVHVDELNKYDDAKEHLEEVIHQIYNIGNVNALEDSLEGLANVFDINLPSKEPKLAKKEDELLDLNLSLITAKVNLPKTDCYDMKGD